MADASAIAELREKISSLHKTAGSDFRIFIDTHDLPFSTQSALTLYSQHLLKEVLAVKEQIAKIIEGE